MEVVNISGKQIRPDGTEEYWWNGVNYGNVIPEELVDAEIEAASKKRKRGIKNNDEGTRKQKEVYQAI